MDFKEFLEKHEAAGDVGVSKLTELQYAEVGDGPWALYIYGRSGYHTGKLWFRKGPMKYPDEEITLSQAKERTEKAISEKREVRICDGGDELVFHSVNGKILYGDGFWSAVGA